MRVVEEKTTTRLSGNRRNAMSPPKHGEPTTRGRGPCPTRTPILKTLHLDLERQSSTPNRQGGRSFEGSKGLRGFYDVGTNIGRKFEELVNNLSLQGEKEATYK